VNEANKIEEKADVELTTGSLADVGARREVRAVTASNLGVGGASTAGAATAPAIDE
jgi:hypothetical protein